MQKKTIVVFVVVAVIAVCVIYAFFHGDEETTQETEDTAVRGNSDDDMGASLLSGLVKDALTNRPLAAKVVVKDKERVVQIGNCSDSGRYSLPLEDGEYQVSAEYAGYVPKGAFDVSHTVDVDGDTEQIIDLWPEAIVTGRVVANGKGVASNLSFFYQKDGSDAANYNFKTIDSDDSGVFELDGAYGGDMNIDIAANGFVKQTLKDIHLEPGKTVDLGDIPMHTGVTVYGTVTDAETKKAIAGAKLKSIDRRGNVLMETTSDADGAYTFQTTDLHTIPIAVEANGYRSIFDAIQTDEDDRYAYDVEMSKLTGIEVVVDNRTGREPIETLVTITDISSNKVVYEQTHENGSYALKEFTGGPYLVHGASADRLTEVSVQIVAGSTATLTLKPFGRINVRFIGKPNKPRHNGFEEQIGFYRTVALNDDTSEKMMPWQQIMTDTVMIDELMPGSYIVEAYPNSYWDGYAWWDQFEEWENMDRSKYHIATVQVPNLEMGETRYVELPLIYSGTMKAKVKIPPWLADKKIEYYILTEDYTARESDQWTTGVRGKLGPNGEFTEPDLPKGEFGIYFIASDGSASYFSGLSVEDDTEKSMFFDLSDSRKQVDGVGSLEMPNDPLYPATTIEYMNASDEEKEKLAKKWLENGANMPEDEKGALWNKHVEDSLKWQKALIEQEKYQKSAAAKRQTEAGDNDE